MFDTEEDIQQKLGGTVVLYDKKPMAVHSAGTKGGKPGITFTDLHGMNAAWVNITDPKLDYKSLGGILGYVNVVNNDYSQAIYLTRMAVRKSIQGLSDANVYIPNLSPNHKTGSLGKSLSWSLLSKNAAFENMVLGVYPKLSEMSGLFSGYATSVAFHRLFAVNLPKVGPFFLEYRGKDIAWSDTPDAWNLSKNFFYLMETLEFNDVPIRKVA